MPRLRTLKFEFFHNEELAEVPFEYRLLFQGIWCIADREGRLEERVKRMKVEIFPYDQVDIAKGLAILEKHGFIIRYEVNENPLIQVVNFTKHQSPHIAEAKSVLQPPPGYEAPVSLVAIRKEHQASLK